jgi:hypothetical protein
MAYGVAAFNFVLDQVGIAFRYLSEYVQSSPYDRSGDTGYQLTSEQVIVFNTKYLNFLKFALKWWDFLTPEIISDYGKVPLTEVQNLIIAIQARSKELEVSIECSQISIKADSLIKEWAIINLQNKDFSSFFKGYSKVLFASVVEIRSLNFLYEKLAITYNCSVSSSTEFNDLIAEILEGLQLGLSNILSNHSGIIELYLSSYVTNHIPLIGLVPGDKGKGLKIVKSFKTEVHNLFSVGIGSGIKQYLQNKRFGNQLFRRVRDVVAEDFYDEFCLMMANIVSKLS